MSNTSLNKHLGGKTMDHPIIIILLAIIVILILFFVGSYKSLQKEKFKVEEAKLDIDIALTKRFDILNQMVEVVKGYASHERHTLENIIEIPNWLQLNETSILEKQDITKKIDESIRKIKIFVEQFPDLKANESFSALQCSLTNVEVHLQAARRVYNASVSSYNQKVQLFPSNVVSKIFKFTSVEFFETEDFKRQDVDIKF